ncbi:MAG: hypothetical protein M0021_01490 [Clostridia bacterium]|uniref:Uncharacterized protein n=1 Tax=Desulforamulus aeronauticus DSM 10349 TaxID=1121421 RepID=A0A1M6X726_9FIRM|nr:hypothetical protein [Desulforamulus aeronauticus]MDA8210548.1 hypothetical protein [Clostridia bacterium]SHL01736.1 hypothetical protein SAMN02745123_03926 [Desulforamulus aeronauticus DSM 10349]
MKKKNILQIYDKRLAIDWDDQSNQNIARIYNYRGIEISEPLHFTNCKEGYKTLLRWVKIVAHSSLSTKCSAM